MGLRNSPTRKREARPKAEQPDYRGVRKALLPLATGLLHLERAQIGNVLEIGLPVAIGAAAGAQAFGFIGGPWWGLGWIAAYVVEQIYSRFRRGSATRAVLTRLARVNGSFAGNIDTATQKLLRGPETRLSEEACKNLAIGLLHRIRHYTEVALDVDQGTRLRATLAVPVLNDINVVVALRVWCYDEPYDDRRWTTLPINVSGAPEAFRKGVVAVIPDLRALPEVSPSDPRAYRSVLCIPVRMGGPNGKSLAVVSIDAGPAGFFSTEDVVEKVIPLVQAAVNLIALVLALRHPGAAHEFDS